MYTAILCYSNPMLYMLYMLYILYAAILIRIEP